MTSEKREESVESNYTSVSEVEIMNNVVTCLRGDGMYKIN